MTMKVHIFTVIWIIYLLSVTVLDLTLMSGDADLLYGWQDYLPSSFYRETEISSLVS